MNVHNQLLCIGISASVLYVPWSVALFAQTRRIHQGHTPVLSYVVMITGFLNFGLFATPSALWMLGGFMLEFRPDATAQSVQLVNDTFVPAGVVALFIDGPFAWNGLIGIYIPLVTYATWFLIIPVYVQKAIRAEGDDQGAEEPAPDLVIGRA